MPPKFDPTAISYVYVRVTGGVVGAASALAPKLGPLGLSPKKIGDDLAKATKKDWAGLRVTCRLVVQNRQAQVEVVPSAGALVIRALKVSASASASAGGAAPPPHAKEARKPRIFGGADARGARARPCMRAAPPRARAPRARAPRPKGGGEDGMPPLSSGAGGAGTARAPRSSPSAQCTPRRGRGRRRAIFFRSKVILHCTCKVQRRQKKKKSPAPRRRQRRASSRADAAPRCALATQQEPVVDRKKVKHIQHDGNITMNDVYETARIMRPRSMARHFSGTVKEILGTCVSVGCTVDGEDPKDLQAQIDDGELVCPDE